MTMTTLLKATPSHVVNRRDHEDFRRQILNLLMRAGPLTVTDFVNLLAIHQQDVKKAVKVLIGSGMVILIMKHRPLPGKHKTIHPFPVHTADKVNQLIGITANGRRYCEVMNALELLIDWDKHQIKC